MKIFREMAVAVSKPARYGEEYLNNRKRRVFGYGMLIITIYFALTILLGFGMFQAQTGGYGKLINDAIPDFRLENGQFWIDQEFEMEDGDFYVYLNTEAEPLTYDLDELRSELRQYSSVILMDSEKVVIKKDGQVQGMMFSEMDDVTLTKQDLMSYMPVLNGLIAGGMVIIYVIQAATFFFGALFTALLAMIVASAVKVKLGFGQIYLLAVYSRTLPLLIKAVASFLPFGIPFFLLINFGISLVFLSFAFQRIRDDQEMAAASVSRSDDYRQDGPMY